MRKIVNKPVENNIVNIKDLVFDKEKIYILVMEYPTDNKVVCLMNSHDGGDTWAFTLINKPYDRYVGGGLRGDRPAKELLNTYSSYELYEFNNIIEFSVWLYKRTHNEN